MSSVLPEPVSSIGPLLRARLPLLRVLRPESVAGLLGLLALLGWLLNVEALQRIYPGLPTMKANTAITLLIAAAGVVLLRPETMGRRRRALGWACAAVVALSGLAALSEDAFGWSLGIDQLLFRDDHSVAGTAPGRMAVNTAMGFGFVGVALLTLNWEAMRRVRIAEVLAVLAGAIGFFGFAGHVYGARTLQSGFAKNFAPIALPTAVAVTLLAAAIVARTRGPLAVLVGSPGPGGVLIRRLLVPTVAVLLIFGWLKKEGERHGILVGLGATVYVPLAAVVTAALAVGVARSLNRTDAKRAVAEQRAEESEARMRQAEKMDAIGSLTAGIAHDFNNVLLVIRGYSDLLLKQMGDGELQQNALKIDQAAEHAAELTHQLLAFSRQQVLRPQLTDLNSAVEESLLVLRRTIGEDIEVKCDLDPTLHSTMIDRAQLRQVIYNLALNARDAMPTGGTLAIHTANAEFDESFVRSHPESTVGSHVLLQITDSGLGMDEKTQAKVFDPFFTTKDEGTGLGLATVYGVVRQSGGYIWLYSEPGIGTIFKIYLPATSTIATAPSPEPSLQALEGEGAILVVEDDEMVRALVTRVLESYGYKVYAASSPREVLSLSEEELRSFDLLMTDIVMPGMGGRELAENLSAVHPSMRLLFTSGYPEDVTIRNDITQRRVHFIEKPYLPSELADTIQKILSGAPPGL